MQPAHPSSKGRFAVGGALAALTVFAYARVAGHGFIDLDDGSYVVWNPIVQSGLTWRGVKWAFTTGHAANWHPLTWLSHMLDCQLYGMNAGGHHLTSLALHVASTLLLFRLFLKTTGALYASAFVAAVFGLHPLHVESVAWVAERKDVLSAFFWILTTLAYVEWTEKKGKARYFAVIGLFTLGLLSKAMLVTLPFTLLLVDAWPLSRAEASVRGIVALVREKIPLFLLAAASSVVTFLVQKAGGAMSLSDRLPFELHVENAFVAYVLYLAKFLAPLRLLIYYPYPSSGYVGWQVAGAALLLLATTVIVLRERARRPWLAFGWLWFLGTLVPVIGLVQVGPQALADRYTYVPLIGLSVAVAFSAAESRNVLVGLLLVGVPAWTALTWRQVSLWKDDATLFGHLIAALPEDHFGYGVLANVHLHERRYDEAIAGYRRALAIQPSFALWSSNLGRALSLTGHSVEAKAALETALRDSPDLAAAHHLLGFLLVMEGDLDHAIEQPRPRSHAEGPARRSDRALRAHPGVRPGLRAGAETARGGAGGARAARMNLVPNRTRVIVLAPVLALGLVLATLAAYSSVAGNGFVHIDDNTYVTDNPHVQAGLSAGTVAWALTTFRAGNWHPLTWLSHALDCELYGLHPAGHHVTSLVLHVVNVLGLFFLLRRWTGSIGRSAFVAALFALHPLHVESVAWIAERKDVLSGFFWIATLWAYALWIERPGIGRYALVLVCYALGLMAKPMLVTLPFVLLLLDVWPLRRVGVPLVREKIPLFLLAAGSSVVTFLVQRDQGAMALGARLPPGLRIENAVVSYAAYMAQTVWPAGLGSFYPHPIDADSFGQVAGSALVLAAATAAAILTWRTRPYVMVGWLWFLGTLVPVIGLVQVGAQARADRYTYLPLIGLSIAVAWAAVDVAATFRNGLRALAAVSVVLAATWAFLTWKQVAYWKDDRALFGRIVELVPDNAAAHGMLGMVHLREGRLPEAIEEYRTALRLEPNYAQGHSNYGMALELQGRRDEALIEYRRAVACDPNLAEAQHNLGAALVKAGLAEEGAAHLEAARRIETARKPTSPR